MIASTMTNSEPQKFTLDDIKKAIELLGCIPEGSPNIFIMLNEYMPHNSVIIGVSKDRKDIYEALQKLDHKHK